MCSMCFERIWGHKLPPATPIFAIILASSGRPAARLGHNLVQVSSGSHLYSGMGVVLLLLLLATEVQSVYFVSETKHAWSQAQV